MRKLVCSLALQMIAMSALSAQTGASNPDADGVYFPGNGVKPPKLVSASPAICPSGARAPWSYTSRTVSIVVGSDGTISKIGIWANRSDPFGQAALAAVERSKFSAGTLHDKSVPVRVLVEVPIMCGKESKPPKILSQDSVIGPRLIFKQEIAEESHPGEPGDGTGFNGTVILSLIVTDHGLPSDIRVVKSLNRELDEKAEQAIELYRFEPAIKDGIPIPARIMVRIDFRFNKK